MGLSGFTLKLKPRVVEGETDRCHSSMSVEIHRSVARLRACRPHCSSLEDRGKVGGGTEQRTWGRGTSARDSQALSNVAPNSTGRGVSIWFALPILSLRGRTHSTCDQEGWNLIQKQESVLSEVRQVVPSWVGTT